MLVMSILDLLVVFLIKRRNYKGKYLKIILIMLILLSVAITFLFYPLVEVFIMYGPILIATMYYDRKLVKIVSILNWLVYTLAIWLNVLLEKYSPNMALLHELQNVSLWKNPTDVLIYRQIPHTLLFMLTSIICVLIGKRGEQNLEKQSKTINEILAMNKSISAAEKIQESSLPDKEFKTKNIEIQALTKPAKEVAGDFYDYFVINDDIIFLVADVSDKGFAAAMFMMKAKNVLSLTIKSGLSLSEAIAVANNILCEDNKENMFVTCFLAKINMKTGQGTYINCGHNKPFIKRNDKTLEQVESNTDMILGVFTDNVYQEYPIVLNDNDLLFLYTDGVTDAECQENVFYGEERLKDNLKQASTDDIVNKIIASIDNFRQDYMQSDDITILTLKYKECEKKELELKGNYESIEKIIDEVNTMLSQYECIDEDRCNIDVAIDEICANIVDYGYEGMYGEINCKIKVQENKFEITIIDKGKAFNPLEVNNDIDELKIGGLGIYLVKQLMDELKYEYLDNQNILYMNKTFRQEEKHEE